MVVALLLSLVFVPWLVGSLVLTVLFIANAEEHEHYYTGPDATILDSRFGTWGFIVFWPIFLLIAVVYSYYDDYRYRKQTKKV